MLVASVGFALLLYDEFDGAAINDVNISFTEDERPLRPLRKRDGHYVFTGLAPGPHTLAVRRPRYHPCTLQVQAAGPDDVPEVLRVRLYRRHADVWRDCAWLAAKAPPGSTLLAPDTKPAFQLHTVGEQDGRPTVTLTGGTLARLQGRRFAAEGAQDTFVITRQLAPGTYQVDTLPKGLAKAKQCVRAWRGQADEDGNALVPVDPTDKGYPESIFYYDDGRKRWVPVSATAPP